MILFSEVPVTYPITYNDSYHMHYGIYMYIAFSCRLHMRYKVKLKALATVTKSKLILLAI